MLRSKELEPRRYKSFGCCIFCGSPDELTDEHIVPEALTGVGQMVIESGSCRSCNNYANEAYEQRVLNTDFLVVRHILELRRKRRGASRKPRKLPPVSFEYDAIDNPSAAFDQEIPVANYPSTISFAIHPAAGKLLGIDRSGDLQEVSFGLLNLGLKRIEPHQVTTQLAGTIGGPERVIAKMAYCYAVAERGLKAFDTRELLDVIMGRRDDIFNFVGEPVEVEHLAMLRLHKFYFRKRGDLNTVIVHLFASFGGPKHEVVIGPDP